MQPGQSADEMRIRRLLKHIFSVVSGHTSI